MITTTIQGRLGHIYCHTDPRLFRAYEHAQPEPTKDNPMTTGSLETTKVVQRQSQDWGKPVQCAQPHKNFIKHYGNFMEHDGNFMEHDGNFMENCGNDGNIMEHNGNSEHIMETSAKKIPSPPTSKERKTLQCFCKPPWVRNFFWDKLITQGVLQKHWSVFLSLDVGGEGIFFAEPLFGQFFDDWPRIDSVLDWYWGLV